MTGRRPNAFFLLNWRLTAPLLILVIWICTLVNYAAPSFDGGRYQGWKFMSGILMVKSWVNKQAGS